MILILLTSVALAQSGPDLEAAYEEAEEMVQEAQEQIADVKQESESLICYLQDRKALEEKHPDVPAGWELPDIEVYEAEDATCSQIPVRREAELAERAAEEAARRAAEQAEQKRVVAPVGPQP